MKALTEFCHRAWMQTVHLLIAILETDLRGRALDWLYNCVEQDSMQADYGRYGRAGRRYHRGPR